MKWLPVAALLSLVAAAPLAPSDQVIAQCGGITLTAADLRNLLASAEPDLRQRLTHDPAALAEFVRAHILQTELLGMAQASKWDQRPDIAARAEQAHDTVITESYLASVTAPDPEYPSDADVQAAYDANKSRFMIPRQYHLAQIFIAVPSNAPRQVDEDARKRLRDLRQQLAKPRADFAEAARSESQDVASATKGGDLGWLREDQLLPVVRDAVSGLQDNALGEPVRAADGWHLLKLLGTRPAAAEPLTDVRGAIVQALRRQKAARNAQAYLTELQRKQPIQINEIGLSQAAQP
jgi:peptidylprolyl isomerase